MDKLDLEKDNLIKLFFSYAVPAIIGICIFSLYSLVDAAFISRFYGGTALAAVEICAPVLSIFSCFSVVVGVGGNTLVGIALGSKNNNRASSVFTLSTVMILILSLLFLSAITIFTKQIAYLFGADASTADDTCAYLKLCGVFAPFYLIGGLWGLTSETAGKPLFSMLGNIASSIGNIVLDYVFIVLLKKGVWGASLASGISAAISVAVFSIGLFVSECPLKIVKFKAASDDIKQIIFNGFSDGISAVSTGIISLILNLLIVKNADASLLSEYTVTLTLINFVGSIIVGASAGLNPIISFNFGAKNSKRIRDSLKLFTVMEIIFSFIASAILIIFHINIISLFGEVDTDGIWAITKDYIPILFFTPVCSISISYFTSINDAKTSAALSVFRSLILRTAVIFAVFLLFGIGYIWYASAISEFIAMIVCLIMMTGNAAGLPDKMQEEIS